MHAADPSFIAPGCTGPKLNIYQPGLRMEKCTNLETIVDLMTRGISLRHANCHEAALKCLDEALDLGPDFFPLLVEKALVLKEQSRFEESVEYFDKSLQCCPNVSEVHKLRAATLNEALAFYKGLVTAGAGNADVFLKQGTVLQRLHRHEEAVGSYDTALRLGGRDRDALKKRGNALLECNRHEEALASYERALAITPADARVLFNKGNVLRELGRFQEALESQERALESEPGLAEARMEQSLCRLASGDFRMGWHLYESRWMTDQLKYQKLNSPAPPWLGQVDLAGKTILLWAEQGFGDTIQFLRYVPMVARTAGHVILRVPFALGLLCTTLNGPPMTILTHKNPMPAHDFHCPLMSLPLAFDTTLDSIPSDIPYLGASKTRVRQWRNRLGKKTKPRIGLAWAGQRREPPNGTRDVPLEALRPLALLDIELISLQKEIGEKDRPVLESMPQLRRLGEELADFGDTASLIENLDLVISVDTAVAHLAGALGKPVWIMLRHTGEWRWLLDRCDSPWYPSARLFRQGVRGDWDGVINDIIKQLKTSGPAALESKQLAVAWQQRADRSSGVMQSAPALPPPGECAR